MLAYNSYITEEHFISCYINGLREELIPFMDIARPDTLEEAYEQAKLHERALAAMHRKMRNNVRATPSPYSFNSNYRPSQGQSGSFTHQNQKTAQSQP